MSLKQDAEEVIRSLGDLLLQLGCDTGCVVPNSALNAGPVNAKISQYQQHLDNLELDIVQALQAAKQQSSPVKPEVKPENEVGNVESEIDNFGNFGQFYNDQFMYEGGQNDYMDEFF